MLKYFVFSIFFILFNVSFCVNKSDHERITHSISIPALHNNTHIFHFSGGKLTNVNSSYSSGEFPLHYNKCSYKV